MIQEINPRQFHVEYKNTVPTEHDYLLFYQDNQILMELKEEEPYLPTFAAIKGHLTIDQEHLIYLFSIDQKQFYLAAEQTVEPTEQFQYFNTQIFRTFTPSWKAFAGITAQQLSRWYSFHKYCGKCGLPLVHSEHERAVCCPHCQITEYPKIAPAVILGIIAGDQLLLTKYSGRPYNGYALIAGFTEIGETFEDTIRREAMEEVGLKVKNIRYYKSQPWAFSDTILAGFFAEADGDLTITLDTQELAEAHWFNRIDLPQDEASISLTSEMIEAFRLGNHPQF